LFIFAIGCVIFSLRGFIPNINIPSILVFIIPAVFLFTFATLISQKANESKAMISSLKDIRTNEVIILHESYIEYRYSVNNKDYIVEVLYKNIETTDCDIENVGYYTYETGDVILKHKNSNMVAYTIDSEYCGDIVYIPNYIHSEKMSDLIWEKIRMQNN
jgi:hypothetical protein